MKSDRFIMIGPVRLEASKPLMGVAWGSFDSGICPESFYTLSAIHAQSGGARLGVTISVSQGLLGIKRDGG